jgi:alpha-methylacyl-CoA racemase
MPAPHPRTGPLTGIRIVEFGGIGPAPFCAMLLAQLGADVVRIDRTAEAGQPTGLLMKSRRSVALDLKSESGLQTAKRLVARADALIEGFRPGVMERLGLGPESLLAANPRLVFGRMTGWGQDGPMAQEAGHDINYIALSGALSVLGTREQPAPPLNLVGDFGGGALYLALGVAAAIVHAQRTGQGQVVDASMVDGSASLLTAVYEYAGKGAWRSRGDNRLDGSTPFYTTYACADGKWISVGALEPAFYAALVRGLGLEGDSDLPAQQDRSRWPELRRRFAQIFATRTRDEWCEHFEGRDACVAPVLELAEAPGHPHNTARASFVDIDGQPFPAPAPRFSRTPSSMGPCPRSIGEHSAEVFRDWDVPAPN